MMNIEISKCVYKVHPVYDIYAADENGNVMNIVRKIPTKGFKSNNGYEIVNVRKYCQRNQKIMQAHRFVCECFNGVIPDGKVIDHINNVRDDNRICNLQLTTQQENCKKSAKNRDYSFAAKNNQNRKCVKAINQDTNEITYYYSMYAVQQYLGINAGIVKMVCEGINYCKSGTLKKDDHVYKFEYVKEEDMPDNYLKSANIRPKKETVKKSVAIRPKISEEEKKKRQKEAVKKWHSKEFVCLNSMMK